MAAPPKQLNVRPTTPQLRAEKFRGPQRAWKNLRKVLKAFEDKKYLKYNRVLGFGGFGLVTEWDVLKPDGTTDRTVALKTIVRKNNRVNAQAMKNEIFWTRRFTGSEHLIQLVDLEDDAVAAVDANNEFSDGVPMTRGCIGMAYPSSEPIENRKGQSRRETVMGMPDGIDPFRIVHSDIDIQNVFIADPKDYPADNEHRWAPLIKIADYGCMVEWQDDWSYGQKRDSLWGKNAYKAPEQFPPAAYMNDRMGSATNVYQIGNQWRTVSGRNVETFGWRVLEEDNYKINEDWINVDLQLRELVAGCMARDILERPSLAQLESIIVARMAALDQQALDDSLKPALNPQAQAFVPGQPPTANPDPDPKDPTPTTELLVETKGQPPLSDSDSSAGGANLGQGGSGGSLNPASMAFDPSVGSNLYRQRAPMGQTEPDWLLYKFYGDYFRETWGDADKFEGFWSKKTLPPDDGEES
ncbi:kinase-like protein [Xylaria cf. heliscus]|nr:kinase-like protein [Xylaria cf. heliscus]